MKKYDNYKDSGVEWIGEIPEHWVSSKVKFEILPKGYKAGPFGSSLITSELLLQGTIKVFSPEHVAEKEIFEEWYLPEERAEEMSQFLVKDKDVVLPIVGTLGLARVFNSSSDGNGIINQRLARISCNPIKLIPEYFCIIMKDTRNYQEYFQIQARGSILSHLNKETIVSMPLVLPEIEEQQLIINYLDRKTTQIDTLIAKKEQFISLLQEERTAIINQAVTKGLDPNVPMKDSGIEWLGEIPEHWEVKKLKLLANIQGRIGFKGYTVGDLVSEGEGALTLGAKHIDKFNQLNLSNPEFISWDKYYESPEIMVQIGDIILTQRGTLGKVILIKEDIGKATINPSMVILSKLKANDYFLYYFFNSDYFKSWIDLTNTATAVPMISQGQLGNLKLVLPNNDEQNQIVNSIQKSIKKIDDIIVKAQQEIELLKEYKTALISEVVTGKVDVRDVILN